MRNCSECGKETKNPKYCSSKCSAKRNNRERPKRKPTGSCKSCSEPLVVSLTYCKLCRPKHNILHRRGQETNYCPVCGVLKTTDNTRINKNLKNGLETYCKKCLSNIDTIRARRTKQYRVDYKGGKCEKCGYNKCLAALQFHHRNAAEKEFGIAALNSNSDNPRIKAELDKCILLCANCHFEEHHSQYEFDEKVIKYEEVLYKRRNKLD